MKQLLFNKTRFATVLLIIYVFQREQNKKLISLNNKLLRIANNIFKNLIILYGYYAKMR